MYTLTNRFMAIMSKYYGSYTVYKFTVLTLGVVPYTGIWYLWYLVVKRQNQILSILHACCKSANRVFYSGHAVK